MYLHTPRVNIIYVKEPPGEKKTFTNYEVELDPDIRVAQVFAAPHYSALLTSKFFSQLCLIIVLQKKCYLCSRWKFIHMGCWSNGT